jgi:hypothetical protein
MKPRDTTKDDPSGTLAELEIHGPDKAVGLQEARGQRELVRRASLPTEVYGGGQELLEAAGVVFGEPYADDPIFRPVTLPEGWRLKPTEHPMWTHLLDDKGHPRASIFYKAAFYDRHAHIGISRRFNRTARTEGGAVYGIVTDCERIIFKTDPIHKVDGIREYEEADRLTLTWLGEHYPDWENKAAYWD